MSQTRRAFPVHILVFLVPAVLIYSLFMIYPLVDTLRLSFYASAATSATQDTRSPEVFVGMRNYEQLLTDQQLSPRLFGAVKNNVIFFLMHMFVQNPIGLLLATLVA